MNSFSLLYGDLSYGAAYGSYSKEEPCLKLGLALLEKGRIFLWLEKYKKRGYLSLMSLDLRCLMYLRS